MNSPRGGLTPPGRAVAGCRKNGISGRMPAARSTAFFKSPRLVWAVSTTLRKYESTRFYPELCIEAKKLMIRRDKEK